jgi:undecaprenyl-diphosphatase
MAMPILLERAVLGIGELARLPNLPSELLLAAGGFVTTAVVGFLSIGWMLRYLTTHSLRIFAFYCFGLGFLTILVSFLR